jgi:hypothetical protein
LSISKNPFLPHPFPKFLLKLDVLDKEQYFSGYYAAFGGFCVVFHSTRHSYAVLVIIAFPIRVFRIIGTIHLRLGLVVTKQTLGWFVVCVHQCVVPAVGRGL